MKQQYFSYLNWECWKNGMWRKVSSEEETVFLEIAITFTGDHVAFGRAMLRVINEWQITCLHHLSDASINRNAFMGQAASSIEINCPEYITRMAWNKLTDRQRLLANIQAEKNIYTWEQRQIKHEQATIKF